MLAKFVNDDGTIRKVWIRLTSNEQKQYKRALLLSWFFVWFCPAHFMSDELESILCGYAPERYIELSDWEK